jgi:hypothetical protein
MPAVASGLDPETAHHWLNVLQDNGIEAELGENGEVLVSDADLSRAKELFADPFEGEEGEAVEEPEVEVPPLDPSDRTEVLARSDDIVSAQRLAGFLNAAGLYAQVESGSSANVLGMEQAAAIIHIAASQRERAFQVLEAFAREHLERFEGAANIDPEEVIEAMLMAPLGAVRVSPKKKD